MGDGCGRGLRGHRRAQGRQQLVDPGHLTPAGRKLRRDQALAFKFSVPRPRIQGDFGDADMHGGQQYAPLLEIEVPQP